MSAPRLKHRPQPVAARNPRAGGFALLITITLLAFLVLLLVSLASLTRVETSVATNNQQISLARQNALLGLNVALGRLQESAGPDQRVTAKADIVSGRGVSKQHWTGVWNADPDHADHGKNIGWLVSGGVAAGEGSASGEVAPSGGRTLVELVGNRTAGSLPEAAVSVLSELIKSSSVPGTTGEQTTGHFAYWVGDEGVKAKATLIDPWWNGTAEEKRHSFVSMQRNGLELMNTAAGSPLEAVYPKNDDNLIKVTSSSQLAMVPASADPALFGETLRSRYHDVTVWSSSVLADVAKGGLKKDLTHWLHFGARPSADEQDNQPIVTTAERTLPGMPTWGMVRSYATTRVTGPPLAPLEQTASESGLAPVVTLLRFGLNISAQAEETMKIHLFPEVVLWNPHNVPLAHRDAGGAPIVYQVAWRISNNRTFTFRPVAAPAKETTMRLGDFYIFDIELTEAIPPGRSLVFRVKPDAGGDAPYVAGGGTVLANRIDDGTSAVINGAAVLSASDLAGGIEWRISNKTADTMILVLRSKTTAVPQGDGLTAGEYQAIRGIGFTGFHDDLLNGSVVDTQDALEAPVLGPRFAFNMFARMASTTSGASFRWLANQNYLARYSPRPSADGNFHSIYFGNNTTKPGTVDAYSYADGTLRASAGTSIFGASARDFVLREVLPQDAALTSLAQLQHANLSLISHYPFYAVGNGVASPYIELGATEVTVASLISYTRFHDLSWLLNRDLWDRYYFSTVPETLTDTELAASDFYLPNARHVPAPDATAELLRGATAFETAASRLMLSGGFNVNSTSPEAWRALLAGHRDLEISGSARHRLSRFIEPSGAPNDVQEGHRILTDPQIDELADKIVEEVLNRGPFLSLADFVNRRLVARGKDTTNAQRLKGTLQAAIDNTGATGPEAVNGDPLFATIEAGTKPTGAYQPQFQGGVSKQLPASSRLAFAPGYLSQADLLTAIGSSLMARSDTFVIRAYGDAQNPITGVIEGKAWCEAVVQRSPRYLEDAVDPWDKPAAGSASDRFGRRFEIVSFRWLSSADI